MLTVERLRELLDYDPETGVFTWRVTRGSRAQAGCRAGCLNTVLGYRVIGIEGVRYFEHRLAWMYTHGVWPADQIDHINAARDDNRLANLRECNHSGNAQNVGVREDNTSGRPGVYWKKDRGKWQAQIAIEGRRIYLGIFTNLEEAIAAYRAAKKKFHTFQPETRREHVSAE